MGHSEARREAFDWTVVIDDDTVIDVPYLDKLLQRTVSPPREVPRMLGADIKMEAGEELTFSQVFCPAFAICRSSDGRFRQAPCCTRTRTPAP